MTCLQNQSLKTKLIQIQGCNNEAELSNIVNSFPERFDMGYTKPVLTLNDKDDLIRFCSKHVVISSVAEEIFSFRKGLSTFGVLHELCKFNEAGLAELASVPRCKHRSCQSVF
jgi:hypothetical protein